MVDSNLISESVNCPDKIASLEEQLLELWQAGPPHLARQQEARIAALMAEVTHLKEWVAILTFQNNFYHINSIMAATDDCDCTLLGAVKLESPTSVP